MSKFKITPGIKMPPNPHASKYPFAAMKVDDSFFVDDSERSAILSARIFGTRHGMKFSARTVTEDGVKGVRIWRVE